MINVQPVHDNILKNVLYGFMTLQNVSQMTHTHKNKSRRLEVNLVYWWLVDLLEL